MFSSARPPAGPLHIATAAAKLLRRLVPLAVLALAAVPSSAVAVQCGAAPSIPGDAMALVRGERSPYAAEAYAIGTVTAARAAVVEQNPAIEFDVRVSLVFKGDVPERLTLVDVPNTPLATVTVGERYFLVLDELQQGTDSVLALNWCGPTFQVNQGDIDALVGAGNPSTVYEPFIPTPNNMVGIWLLGAAAVLVSLLIFRHRGRDAAGTPA